MHCANGHGFSRIIRAYYLFTRVKIMASLKSLPKGRRDWILSQLLFAGALALALTACNGEKKPATAGSGRTTPPPRKVQTVPVIERRVERSLIALGSLSAHERATLSAKVPGRVQSIQVDIGSRVRRGEVLAQIEPRDYELKVQQAAAALSQSRAVLGLPLEGDNDQVDPEKVNMVKEAHAVLDEAKANLGRSQQLTQEKIISESQLDTAQSAYLVALNRFQDTQEKVRQQQALVAQRRVEHEIAKQQLADTTLRAPFDGGIQERPANVGEYLTLGLPVVTLVRLDPLRLRVEVSERDASRIELGQTVRFTLEGDTNVYSGKIHRLSPALDENTRMLAVEADIPNDGRFHSGYFVRAEIVTAPDAVALTIPAQAVVAFAGLEKAFTCQKGKAAEKRITTGKRGQDWVEVVAGLERSEEVILNPGNLQNGHPVIVEPTAK